MQIVKWYVGIGKDKNGRSILSNDAGEMKLEAMKRLSRYRGGVTVYQTEGGWVDANNRLITERGLVFEIVTDNPLTVDQQESIRHYLIGAFDQSGVMVVEIGNPSDNSGRAGNILGRDVPADHVSGTYRG
jgi:hypothetical protein